MMVLNYILTSNYLVLLTCYTFSVILGLIIYSLSYFIAVQNPDSEKLSAYECGFEPFEDARNTFDIKFYLIAILFIIFDIEVAFLFPWSVAFDYTGSLGFWVVIDFIIELVIGYVYIWKKGALD